MNEIASDTTARRAGAPDGNGLRQLGLPALCRGNLAVFVVAVVITGCGRGSNTAPVSGLVTLDGKPIAGAAVLFMPVEGGVPGRAATKDDGTFSLTTFKDDDGALVGRHRVAVSKVETTGAAPGPDGASGKLDGRQIRTTWLTPERYGTPTTSGLEATVERGSKNAFDFRLTSE